MTGKIKANAQTKSHILGSQLTTDNQRIRINKDNQVEPAGTSGNRQ
jgi:hypothetical protein